MSEVINKKPNKLASEKSPYLLQHAYNPVNWYPWGDEAFEKAKKENKPIFLSIGYSTCHWCHVMEKESFEDLEVAELLNKYFIAIKVDREERPDIDNVYMTACQLMSQSGGWPLSVFMTYDKKPFFIGTYFSKGVRYGRIGMMELLPHLYDIWINKKEEVLESANHIVDILSQVSQNRSGDVLSEKTLKLAYEQLSSRYDSHSGGFGSAPKFPSPHNLSFLLRYWKRTGNKECLEIVEKTLQSMRNGGIYDHIGFGFHRYSTDSSWLVPHFEKMLYDQAMHIIAYTEAYQVTEKNIYKETAKEIIEYIRRDMTSSEGGFYSAEDADSEGHEGKFYVWTVQEINNVLGKEDTELFIKEFNLKKEGNFLEEATREKTGDNIAYLKEIISSHELREKLEKIRKKLFEYRENRIHPYKDDKILTDWNGLMIVALSKAACAFNEPEYVLCAKKAVEFVFNNLWKENKLLHRYRDGQACIEGNLSDYAFLIWGLLELYEATFEVKYLKDAIKLNEVLIDKFWDKDNSGFYFTSCDNENLIVRQKEIYDGAIPSGNSVAMLNLLRLSKIVGNSEFEEYAEKLSSAFSKDISTSPIAHTQLMSALDFSVGPSSEIVVVGDVNDKNTKEMLFEIQKRFIPNKVILLKSNPDIEVISSYVKDKVSLDGKPTAYVCSGFSCKKPINDISEILKLLS